MTAAERLAAAAVRLRAAAEGTFCDGLEPWRVITLASGFQVVEGQDPVARCADRGDATYIALMGPQVALKLADLLECEMGRDGGAEWVLDLVEAIEQAEPGVPGVTRG